MSDPDNLDGLCDPALDHGPNVTDGMVPFVVLFASLLGEDLQPYDWPAVERRAAQWRELFG